MRAITPIIDMTISIIGGRGGGGRGGGMLVPHLESTVQTLFWVKVYPGMQRLQIALLKQI